MALRKLKREERQVRSEKLDRLLSGCHVLLLIAILIAAAGVGPLAQAQQPRPPFVLEEATVASIHAAFDTRAISCSQLVRMYLDRIEAYDDRGPAIHALISVNPRAMEEGARLDRAIAAGTARPPLHCIPVVLKDNFHTADMPTTGGARTFARLVPPGDAFVVNRFREAGAIILGKANLTELALSGTTVSSIRGQTKNPYDLTRTAGGSSGGTGAAIAANLGVLGTGSDTGQSIRSPSSANALVGLRPTHGLISRDGVMPFSPTQDEIGPMTRTVEDNARMLDVMAGYDPADPGTAFSAGHVPRAYTAALDRAGLKGARVGLLLDFIGHEAVHAPVNAVIERAVETMTAAGATVVRMRIPSIDALTRDLGVMMLELQPAFDRYLAGLGPAAPVKTFAEYVARGEFHPSLRGMLETGLAITDGPSRPEYEEQRRRRGELRQAVMTAMAVNRLDAILYPHQRRLVVPLGDDQVERNGVLSNSTGFPALTFPGGFSDPTGAAPIGVPVGLELLGPEWSEPTLLRLAFAYEQTARVRKPPRSTPPLR